MDKRKQLDSQRLPMSVIIPVYNKANELEQCIESLAKQTVGTSAFEAILINDGSSDNSLDICNKLASEYQFVRVLSQENQGVSGARNAGMNAATGEYLLFLDAGDSINNQAIQLLLDSFQAFGSAVDVVACRLKYYYPTTGTTKFHEREQWLTSSGVYPLNEYPFIAQSTMNVCIRNRFEHNILFESKMKMGEDQLFVTKNLQRTGNLGYCRQAEYRYIRDNFTASSQGNNPFYAFDDMMMLFESLINIAHTNDKMKSYAYQLILYNFAWRITSTKLLPTNPDKAIKITQLQQLQKIAQSIPLAEYIASPYLDEFHKTFLFKTFDLIEEPVHTHYDTTSSTLQLPDATLWSTSIPKLVIERCQCEHGTLALDGRLTSPFFMLEKQPVLQLACDGKLHRLSLSSSSYDYMGSHYPTAKCWHFHWEMPVNGRHTSTINVTASLGTKEIPAIDIELGLVNPKGFVHADCIEFTHCTVSIAQSKITVSNPTLWHQKKFRHLLTHPNDLKRRLGFRLLASRFAKERVWLYVDLPTTPAKGNALVQLLHDIQKDDNITRYYISNFANVIESTYPELKNRVIPASSKMHKVLALRSELVLASRPERSTYWPFKRNTHAHLTDLAVTQRYIYLRHNILHAHLPWRFSYDRLPFDYAVVSTEFERDNLQSNYHFPANTILASGAPRLDLIETKTPAHSRRIIYVPSWRSCLIGGPANNRVGNNLAFTHSNLYRGMQQFFKLLSESKLLENHNWYLDIKLHPNFNCYEHLFTFQSERIRLVDEVTQESNYALAITDFSSYIYDFVYAGAQVMYFVPDHLEFQVGLNNYSKLDLPFEEGFGSYCETAEEAFQAVCDFIEKPHDDFADIYRKRRENFFLHTDGKNRERLYAALKHIADGLGN